MNKRTVESYDDYAYLYRYIEKMFKETPNYAMTMFGLEYDEDHISNQYSILKKQWREIHKEILSTVGSTGGREIVTAFIQTWPSEIYKKYQTSKRAQKLRDKKRDNFELFTKRSKRIEIKGNNITALNELKLKYNVDTYDEVIERLIQNSISVTP